MSGNILRFIPTEPDYVPAPMVQHQVRDVLVVMLPGANVHSVVNEEITFIDPGSNLEQIVCPICRSDVGMEWWIGRMERAYSESRFWDLSLTMPCCQEQGTLNDLCYQWSAGFARYLIEVHDVDGDITEQQLACVEAVLGCAVRKIWAHY